MAQSTLEDEGFRDKLRRRLNHFRDRSRGPLNKNALSYRDTQAQAPATTKSVMSFLRYLLLM
jgi:hypothetical protein